MSKPLQPLADIVLQHHQGGSTIPLKAVTPAEVMLLVSMHHVNVGKDPVVFLKERPVDFEDKLCEPLQAEIKAIEARYAEGLKEAVTEEVRDQRERSRDDRVAKLQSRIAEYQATKAIRFTDAGLEKARLATKYNNLTLERMFPGDFPRIPTSFDEARKVGIRGKGPEANSPETFLSMTRLGAPAA